jgi:hypothetical protein
MRTYNDADVRKPGEVFGVIEEALRAHYAKVAASSG